MAEEKNIENKIKEYLKTVEGLFYFKEHGGMYGTAGIPDLIICYKGRFIGLEVKATNGKATPLQDATIRKINSAGGIALVVKSVDDAKLIIEEVDELVKNQTV